MCGRLTVARGERIILGKRLVLEFTDRENHFLSRFETVTVLNVGRNEGNLGTVRAINNSKSLRRGDGRTNTTGVAVRDKQPDARRENDEQVHARWMIASFMA